MTAISVIHKQYVEWRENNYWIMGSRVSLDSVVYAFLNGTSAESIVQSFPVLYQVRLISYDSVHLCKNRKTLFPPARVPPAPLQSK